MTSLQDLLQQAAVFFDALHQPWALVGGLAVSVRTEPRFTRDLDLAVAVADDPSAEALVHDLHVAGFRALATVEQEATHRLATVRMVPFGDAPRGMMLDLLFASSGIEAEICADSERIDVFTGVSVPVARLYHLIVLKALARDDRARPQDAVDLRQLILAARESDLAAACEAARLVEQRGYHRARNVVRAVQDAWGEFRASPK